MGPAAKKDKTRPDLRGGSATPPKTSRATEWLLAAALVATVFLAYQPAWYGGLVWDDDMHVTRPDLHTWHGLWRIWFEQGASAQYYPVLHTAFWVENQLWGDATLGYHLVNLALHSAAALMVAWILRRLAVPGAYLAAAIFALHPIQVESVAWMTEQKNTLSAVFYLAAMLAYFRFDETRRARFYAAALVLFVLGVMSKTVTATLPGALLVIFWWRRGRLEWKRDVMPLLPFFLLGATAGLLTAWWELEINQCVGPDFEFTPVQRLLLASRAAWFYAWKLFWPTKLLFIYPRWQIDPRLGWQYVFPLAAVLLLAGLWAVRRWSRAPLAAALYFGGTLFPVLGFFNLYTFQYSLVANHYQYLACLGIITLSAAGLATLLVRWRLWGRPAGSIACLALLAVLAGLTWQQSRMYADIDTLYVTTLEMNPTCWLAENNLGNLLAARGQIDEAIIHLQKALELKPDLAEAHANLGRILADRGHHAEAIAQHQAALKIKPHEAVYHYNLAAALGQAGRTAEAVAEYQRALEIEPSYANARNNLAAALADSGRTDEAIAQYRKALESRPDYANAQYNLGMLLQQAGKSDEAIVHLRQAARIQPTDEAFHFGLALALTDSGQDDEAATEFLRTLQRRPEWTDAYARLGQVLCRQGKYAEAVGPLREAVRQQPNQPGYLNQLAWLLATSPDGSVRNGREAVELAQQAAKLCAGREPAVLGSLAAAYAEAGRSAEAVEAAQRAIKLAAARGDTALVDALNSRLKLYQAGTAYHEKPQPHRP
jgi:protein O-mannosyl-transferase